MHQSVSFAPPDAYLEPLTIRSYEVTRAGYPQPGTVLRYLEYLATRASGFHGYTNVWYADQGSAWLVREMTLMLGWLPPMDTEIMMATWVAEFRRVQAFREYALWHRASNRLIARARARWAYVQRHTGQLMRVPDDMLARFSASASATRLPSNWIHRGDNPLWQSQQTIIARENEADVHQHVNNCVYGDWLYDGFAATLRAAGHTHTDARPRVLALEYLRQVRPGDQILITTAVHPDGSRRLCADQTVEDVASGEVVLRGLTRYLVGDRWLANAIASR